MTSSIKTFLIASLLLSAGSEARLEKVLGSRHGGSGLASLRSRQHQAMALQMRSAEKRDECVYGSWSCDGNDLQRCYDGAYNTVRSCGDLVCSASQDAIGCMWPSDASAYVAENATTATPTSSSVTASVSATDSASATRSISAEDLHRLAFSTTTGASSSTAAATSSSAKKNKSSSTSASASATSSAAASTTSAVSSGGSASSSAPHWVIYSDEWLTAMPSVSDLKGYNRFILAFWMSNSGAVDNAEFWTGLGAQKQQETLTAYNDAGISLMVSAFGSTDNPSTDGVDPTQCAQNLATWVKANNLNGVDIDYEDDTAFNNGYAEAWLITFQAELRSQLPAPYIISHAPQAPWFTTNGQYSGGGYLKIHEQVGSGIDFYNVQFYNQGVTAYTTCDSLLTSSEFPGTSVFEIAASGVELDKIVIGKPINSGAASNGYMDTSTLNSCVTQAKAKGWNAGVMYWEYDTTALSVMAAIQN